jgi:cytochrome c oxidase accessory protein FixG
VPIESQLTSIRKDGRRVGIHPLDVHGRFITARRICFALLVAIYVAAPLVSIGGHPAVHLDVGTRRFYLFGGTFNAQDFWLVLFLATAFAFAMLFVTAWRGRLWCGWACPQTVFLEGLFRPIERLIDGPRNQRLKQAAGPWTVARVARLGAKQAIYLLFAGAIAHVALALFLSTHDLLAMMREGPRGHGLEFGWAVAVTGVLYFNFAWFREQFCVILCPYGRLQSVLHDSSSIVIGYDARRGEPRAHLQKSPQAEKAGDCIDCKKCVWACPTAIDIRHGFQMECLACAQCIDACDDVMDKLKRPRGLVRYAALAELEGKPSRILRPRLFVYAALTLVAATGFAFGVGGRTPFEANLVRAPGVPWVLEGDTVRNQIEVHLVNKHAAPARFRLSIVAPFAAEIRGAPTEIALPSLGDTRVPVVASTRRSALHPGRNVLTVRVEDLTSGATREQPWRYLAPGLN